MEMKNLLDLMKERQNISYCGCILTFTKCGFHNRTFKTLISYLRHRIGFPLSSTVSFGLYQVWLMSRVDRIPSVPNQTQQEPARHLLHRDTWHHSKLWHAHKVQSLTQNAHASLQAHQYTNNTDRHANTCVNMYTYTHRKVSEWWTGTIMILNNW